MPGQALRPRILDRYRRCLRPGGCGATADFSPQALETLPQGADAFLSQVLLRTPGVVRDGSDQVHLRGECANVRFRLNGIELPDHARSQYRSAM